MMINSTTSTDRTAHADLVPAQGPAVARQPSPPPADVLSTDNAAFLRSELARQPEIRPEVVQRARAIISDVNYPSRDTLKSIASLILNSADLSEDHS
jgi:hypothetical protein